MNRKSGPIGHPEGDASPCGQKNLALLGFTEQNMQTSNENSHMWSLMADAPAAERIAKHFWSLIKKHDPVIAPPAPNSVGSASGDRFNLQWWTSQDGHFFAAQVLDRQEQAMWDAYSLPRTDIPGVAGMRMLWGMTGGDETHRSLMQVFAEEAFVPHTQDRLDDARHPSFVDIIAAGVNNTGMIVVRDETARIEQLESDLQYWSGLAKTLSKKGSRSSGEFATDGRIDDWASQQVQNTVVAEDCGAQTVAAPSLKLRDIDDWAAKNAHRIIVMPRAISATKRSNYENPELLYACLELLANEYTLVKNGLAPREAFKDKADRMGLSVGGSVEPSNAGEAGDQYFIRWNGTRRFLDQHLGKGSARDPRFCMRLYFTWCEKEQKVIVGSMPAHLDCSK